MKVDVETLSPVSKQMTLVVEQDRVNKAFEQAYRTLSKTVQIKGFRPGKVPRGLIERRFGPSVANDIAERLVQETVEQAFRDASLEPVGAVTMEKDEVRADEDFRYVVRFDVTPELGSIDLDGLKVETIDDTPTDEEVQFALERKREMQTELVPVEDKGADTGNIVTIDFVGKLGDEPFEGGSAEDHDIELGTGSFIPGFDDQLVGALPGESRTVTVTFPEDYGAKELAGNEATFDVTVHRVRRKEVPDLDDDLAVDLGYKDLAEMRDKLSGEIREAKAAQNKRQMGKQVLETLTTRNDFPVPDSMVEKRAEALADHFKEKLRSQGVDPAVLKLDPQSQTRMFAEEATRQIREHLLLGALAAEHGITVTDAELDARLEEFAERTGRAIQWVRANFGQGAPAEGLKQQLEKDKVLDFILSRADLEAATMVASPGSDESAVSANAAVEPTEEPAPALAEGESTEDKE